jgi:hypothetical protein
MMKITLTRKFVNRFRVTKMPPFHKNFPPKSNNMESSQSSTHKNYSPLGWEGYFDELFYLSDVRPI